jgi:anthranilate phosphoribosyltransferase
VRDVLAGLRDDRETLARRELVAANAAGALRVAGLAESWPDAVDLARRVLASGGGLRMVERLAARHPAPAAPADAPVHSPAGSAAPAA